MARPTWLWQPVQKSPVLIAVSRSALVFIASKIGLWAAYACIDCRHSSYWRGWHSAQVVADSYGFWAAASAGAAGASAGGGSWQARSIHRAAIIRMSPRWSRSGRWRRLRPARLYLTETALREPPTSNLPPRA